MLIIIRFFLVLYALIAIGTGALAISEQYNPSIAPFTDNSHRFIAAIWASTGLAFLYVAWQPSEVALFRFLMIALFIGGVVRAVALVHYPPNTAIIAVILLELIPTPILWWMHANWLVDKGI